MPRKKNPPPPKDALLDQTLVSLASAGALIPTSTGRPVSKPTMHRYATQGFHGVILESIKIGNTKYTSKEAIERFLEKTEFVKASGT